MMGAVRLDGAVAAMVYEGGTDVPVMQTFAETELRRILRPGDIVVMDNLAAHKDPEVIEAIERDGISVWHLPPYSPDYNPIEQMWSKVKGILRSIKARTAEALLEAIGVALRAVTATDAQGWFAHCGRVLVKLAVHGSAVVSSEGASGWLSFPGNIEPNPPWTTSHASVA
jgi:transposase